MMTVAFAGGGTGGHIYPGLAVALEVRGIAASKGQSVRIVWLGSKSALDRDIVSNAKDKDGRSIVDEFCGIRAGKLRRYLSWKNVADVFKVVLGFFDSLFCLMRARPDVLFSKGGFVSVPPCAAARLLHIKVFTHECDFSAGLATRINARFADKVLLSYEETKQYIKEKYRAKTAVTGNPVRGAFYEADAQRGLEFLHIQKKDKPVVLFIGGSLGSQQINALVKENLDWLCAHFTVVHQTGNCNEVPHSSQSGGAGDYLPYPFIYSEMPDVMAAADIVAGRAGANSIWECAVLRRPMVLIPLCGEGTRGDQVDNAKYFEQRGAAITLQEGKGLRTALERLLDEGERQKMARECAKMTGEARPAQVIAKMILGGE